jgi:hypothetical protein
MSNAETIKQLRERMKEIDEIIASLKEAPENQERIDRGPWESKAGSTIQSLMNARAAAQKEIERLRKNPGAT